MERSARPAIPHREMAAKCEKVRIKRIQHMNNRIVILYIVLLAVISYLHHHCGFGGGSG